MEEEYLMKCVVDPIKRAIYIYSSEGDYKTIECETVEEFMGVLNFIRETCPEERLFYSDPFIGDETRN